MGISEAPGNPGASLIDGMALICLAEALRALEREAAEFDAT